MQDDGQVVLSPLHDQKDRYQRGDMSMQLPSGYDTSGEFRVIDLIEPPQNALLGLDDTPPINVSRYD